ncbi:hypothetical protein FE840_000925 [Peteryoungia desertarenae]|uniref:Uncharacterized protein n=1 Tax=Peteryoungia desertarenae TaxID=1813451 RepID=A0ABX6QJG1_9HYPH|nr:hypothetical protein [Peteryoungia desertarenae]QLF68230.1 hypothetical protein FE840_000925 [Peteryoungia desertarenae]
MQLIGTKVLNGNHEKEGRGKGVTVVFSGDGGETVTVEMAETEDSSLTQENAVQKARVVLLQLAAFDLSEASGNERNAGDDVSPAVQSVRQERADKNQRGGSALEEGIEDSFPASDPVSAAYTSTPGST